MVIVNLQGDEPALPSELVRKVAMTLLEDKEASLSTLATPLSNRRELFDPNVVKVVLDQAGRALYFSRAPVPWHRDRFARDQVGSLPPGAFLRHIGIYAYRAGFLHTFTQLPAGKLEQLEGLEQLRVLEAGHAIAVAVSPVPFPPGVDTEADLERANRIAAEAAAR